MTSPIRGHSHPHSPLFPSSDDDDSFPLSPSTHTTTSTETSTDSTPISYTDILQSQVPFIDEPSSLLLSFAARNLRRIQINEQKEYHEEEYQYQGINSQIIVLEKELSSQDPEHYTFRHIRKTEIQEVTYNPDFITTIPVPYHPVDATSPIAQQLRLELYHIHSETRTCLGYVDVTLSHLISMGALTLNMIGGNDTLIHVMIVDQKPEPVVGGDVPHLITKPVRIEHHFPGRTLLDDDEEEIRIEKDTIGWCHWFVMKSFLLLCLILYSFLTLSCYQLYSSTTLDQWELIPIIIMLCTNAIHSLFKFVGIQAYDVIQEFIEDAILPCCIALPFNFARRFEISTGFFLVRTPLLLAVLSILVICGIYQSITTCRHSRSSDPLCSTNNSSYQFSFGRNVSEVLLGFIVVGLSFILWTTLRFRQLMFGGISLCIALVLQDSYLDIGRLMFYTSLLLTEQYLRIPNQGWVS